MKQKQWLAVGGTAFIAVGTILGASTRTADAQADQYERFLGGVKLNSKASNVLKAYGNPNDVVIGDVGFRE
ncbi:MAG: hypothetical protein H7Y38_02635, partial [Armatimonadetes bacterium]|nr:hypothetical protein [Armatimonadota bacterium]